MHCAELSSRCLGRQISRLKHALSEEFIAEGRAKQDPLYILAQPGLAHIHQMFTITLNVWLCELESRGGEKRNEMEGVEEGVTMRGGQW